MLIHNFAEANAYLAQFYAHIRPGYTLDTMHGLMELLGQPQNAYRVIHVAGTSGKTSTAYYAAALLSAAGYKTGLTVSPHVDEVNERVQINGHPVSEADFCAALSEFSEILETSQLQPSWFEAMVAFAYWYFAREKVEYAVIEVGLGGLLDGTNVITREDKTCVITDIGFDHTAILGNTLQAIAGQKAGIIHHGNDVVMYEQPAEVTDVVKTVANEQGAQLELLSDYHAVPSLPEFQQRNFGLAQAAVETRLKRDGKPGLNEAVIGAAQAAYIPGRMEIIDFKNKTIILDGAHNAQKLSVLSNALHVKYPNTSIAALVGFAQGDEQRLASALTVIQDIAQHVIATSFVSAKDNIKASVDPQLLAERANFDVEVEADVEKAFARLMARPESVLVVTGSFYLLNHIRPLMLKG